MFQSMYILDYVNIRHKTRMRLRHETIWWHINSWTTFTFKRYRDGKSFVWMEKFSTFEYLNLWIRFIKRILRNSLFLMNEYK